MKRRYADGGIYTAEMGLPPMELEKVSDEKERPGIGPRPVLPKAPAPKVARPPVPRSPTTGKRMEIPLEPDQSADLKPGQKIGVKKEKSEAYKQQYAKGGYTKGADGIAKRGKTRGTMVMCKGGMYK